MGEGITAHAIRIDGPSASGTAPHARSEAQVLRSSRKRSTGTEAASALTRVRPTPVHWKPHFSSTRREAALVTRAAEVISGCFSRAKAKSMTARAASVARPPSR